MKKTVLLGALVLAFAAQLLAQTNLSLIAHLPQYNRGQGVGGRIANDVTAFVAPNGTEYAIIGYYKGTSVISLANPAAPVEVAWLPAQNGTGNLWRDVEVWGNYCYVTQEQEGTGVHIINLSDINNITATWWIPTFTDGTTMTNGHSLYVADGFMYINGGAAYGGTVKIFSLANPTNPTYLGRTNDGYVHDSYARGNRLYTANIYEGTVRIYDIANKSAPQLLATQPTPVAFPHNCWLSDDSRYLFVTEERADAPLTSYDISDLTNIVEKQRYTGSLSAGAIFHNIYMREGDFGVVANYTDGVRILDCSRPHNIVEVGNFDTYPSATIPGPFYGVWACYPYLPSGKLLASDLDEGLFVFQPTYQRAAWLEGKITDAQSGTVLNAVDIAISFGNTTTNGSGDYATGTVTAGTYAVTYSKAGYISQTVSVVLANNQLTIKDIQLERVVATQNLNEAVKVAYLPNPFTDFCQVNYTLTNNEPANIQITNALGQIVETQQIEAKEGSITIGKNLTAGIYFLQIEQNGRYTSPQKIVKQ